MTVTTTAVYLVEMAEALLARDELRLRLFVQAWLREQPRFTLVPKPETANAPTFSAAAALVEMLAERAGQQPPQWTSAAVPLPEPFFVMRRAERPGFTRELCLAESPEPLKRRNIFAPPNFLMMA